MKKYLALAGAAVFVAGVVMTSQMAHAVIYNETDVRGVPLREGDMISASQFGDPDIYIVSDAVVHPPSISGYKRLFLNPTIFSFYSHLGGFKNVKQVTPAVRDHFQTSGLFRNCETNKQEVWATEVTGEDIGIFHHVELSGDAAVQQDVYFFSKVFCINTREENFYPKSIQPYTSLSQVPSYTRSTGPAGWKRINKEQYGFGFSVPTNFIEGQITYDNQVFAASPPSGGMLVYVLNGDINPNSYSNRTQVRVGSQTGYMATEITAQSPLPSGQPAACYVKRIDTALPNSKHLEIIFSDCSNAANRQGVTTPLLTDQMDLITTILSNFTFIQPNPPTPPPGCYYQEVQCFAAPCNPVLVCSSPTPTTGPVTIQSVTVTAQAQNGSSTKYSANISGYLPNPCYTLAVSEVGLSNGRYGVTITATSNLGPDQGACVQSVQQFSRTVDLGTYGGQTGTYQVYVNGQYWTSFTISNPTY